MIGQVVDAEFAVGEEKILHWFTLAAHLGFREGEQRVHLGDLGGVLNVVGFDVGMDFLEVGDEVLVLIDEDGAAEEVERSPEESLVGESEDEEVARGELADDGEDGGELGGGHLGGRGI